MTLRKFLCMQLIGISLAAISPSPAFAVDLPKWVRVSITGDASTSITISWNTDGEVGGEIQYGKTGSYGITETAPLPKKTSLGWLHVFSLAGLEPETTYHYHVGNITDGYSPDFTFTTGSASLCKPLKFVGVGDSRGASNGSSDTWKPLLAQAASGGAAFIVHAGDFIDDGADSSQWMDHLNKSGDYLPSLPIMGTLGDLDRGPGEGAGANYNSIFAFPKNPTTNTSDYYSFDYGLVHIAVLSASTFNGNGFEAQIAWLNADLAATTAIWKVVVIHRPPYSSGKEGMGEDIQTYLVPVFDSNKVDVVLSAHDNDYERFKPLRGGEIEKSYADGTLYIVSGGGGGPLDILFPYRTKQMSTEKCINNKPCENTFHYMVFEVTGLKMRITAHKYPGGLDEIFDDFEIVKKISPDPCAQADAGFDASTTDSGIKDAEIDDTGVSDAGIDTGIDTGMEDTLPSPDSELPDAGSVDADFGDSGAGGDGDVKPSGCSCSQIGF